MGHLICLPQSNNYVLHEFNRCLLHVQFRLLTYFTGVFYLFHDVPHPPYCYVSSTCISALSGPLKIRMGNHCPPYQSVGWLFVNVAQHHVVLSIIIYHSVTFTLHNIACLVIPTHMYPFITLLVKFICPIITSLKNYLLHYKTLKNTVLHLIHWPCIHHEYTWQFVAHNTTLSVCVCNGHWRTLETPTNDYTWAFGYHLI